MSETRTNDAAAADQADVVVCRHCLAKVRVRGDGRLVVHTYTLIVSRRAVTTVGHGSVKRRCAGSGRPAEEAGR